MSEKNQIQNTTDGDQLPTYLAETADEGRDQLGEAQQTSHVKCVQMMSDAELVDEFGAGSVVIMPDRQLIATAGEPFDAVTLFFWASFEQWRDIKDKSGGPIEAQTVDPDSQIARNCKVPRYTEAYQTDPSMSYRFCTCLNFLIELPVGRAVLSFRRGGMARGNQLRGYLYRRGGPIWSHRVTFSSEQQSNRDGQRWFQITHNTAQFIAESEVDHHRAAYTEAAAAHDRFLYGLDSEAAR